MTATYTVSGNRIRVTSAGGSISYTSKSEIEASILRIITSDAFADRGFDALSDSTIDILIEWSNALRLFDRSRAA